MTSKEELERVRSGSFVDCKKCNDQWCIGCLCCRNKLSKSKELDIIEKDLDQLEKLEKENQELKQKVNHFEKIIEDIKNIPDYDLKVALVKYLGFEHMFDNCKELTPLPENKEKK